MNPPPENDNTGSEPRAELHEVLNTERLAERPSRTPDHEAESRALVELVRELADDPRNLLRKLADTVLDLCRADSAGVSILERAADPETGEDIFRWRAIAGAFEANLGEVMPRAASPCGAVIDRDSVLLFNRPERHYPYPVVVDPPIVEALLAPFHVSGELVGTVWAIAHTEEREFDREDARLLTRLAGVAAVGHELTAALEAAREELSRRLDSEALLREREAVFRGIIESAVEYGIFTLDLEGKVTNWNTGAERIFGWHEEEVLGRSGAIFFTPEERAAGEPEGEMRLAREAGSATDERWHIRKDGSRFWGSGFVWPLRDPDDAVTGYLKIFRDRTAEREAEQRLREMNVTLEERVRERTREVRELVSRLTIAEQQERRRIAQILHDDLQQLLYGMEFRLKAIRRSAERSEPVEDEVGEVIGHLTGARQTTRRLAMVLSPPTLKDPAFSDTVHWLADQMEELYGLHLEVEADRPYTIADEDRRVLLSQVVRELLFNVVKHAGTDRARIELSEEGDRLVIRVSDPGRGFEIAELEQEEWTPEGGLGLHSAVERIELLGGRVDIRSEPGEGTAITLYTNVEIG